MEIVIASIVSLGHKYEIAEKAVEATKSEDVNVNLEWIEKHSNDPEILALLNNNKMEVENVDQPAQENPAEQWGPISGHVDQVLVAQLQDMGFSKNVAEKALFLTQDQKSLEAALAWTEQHQGDEDYEEALLMQIGGNSSSGPKLSEQEARIKARELQNKLREDRKKREEQDEFEKEKKRIQAGKLMGDSQREIQELKKRQDALQLKQQREQDAIDKQRMLDQLQRDREERFGKKAGGAKTGAVEKKEPTVIEKFQIAVKQVKMAHPRNIFLDKAQVCLKTILTYISNIVANPSEEKFRKINLENKAFQTRVGECFGAKDSLSYLGFTEDSTFLVCQNPNLQLLQQAIQILEQEIISA